MLVRMETAVKLVKVGQRDISLWLHTAKNPSDDEWDAACEMHAAIGRQDPQRMLKLRSLVLSDGGAPTSKQRSRLFSLFAAPFHSSLISTALDNPLKRAIANTIASFMNPKFRMHSPEQSYAALQHVDLVLDSKAILAHLDDLQRQLAPIETLALMKQALTR